MVLALSSTTSGLFCQFELAAEAAAAAVEPGPSAEGGSGASYAQKKRRTVRSAVE